MSFITVISPAKTQDFSPVQLPAATTEIRFAAESSRLVQALQKQSVGKLQQLMSVSEELAALNYQRYQVYNSEENRQTAKAALYAFEGDVYKSLEKDQYTAETLTFAQQHLRILSGLYGLLRPLDKIEPYRLEMKTPLGMGKSANLYQFWGNKLLTLLEEDAQEVKADTLVNLASVEYSKALNLKKSHLAVITPVFKEFKAGKLSTVAIFAKQARGAMANHILQHKITQADDLKNFSWGNYHYSPADSSPQEWVFTR